VLKSRKKSQDTTNAKPLIKGRELWGNIWGGVEVPKGGGKKTKKTFARTNLMEMGTKGTRRVREKTFKLRVAPGKY